MSLKLKFGSINDLDNSLNSSLISGSNNANNQNYGTVSDLEMDMESLNDYHTNADNSDSDHDREDLQVERPSPSPSSEIKDDESKELELETEQPYHGYMALTVQDEENNKNFLNRNQKDTMLRQIDEIRRKGGNFGDVRRDVLKLSMSSSSNQKSNKRGLLYCIIAIMLAIGVGFLVYALLHDHAKTDSTPINSDSPTPSPTSVPFFNSTTTMSPFNTTIIDNSTTTMSPFNTTASTTGVRAITLEDKEDPCPSNSQLVVSNFVEVDPNQVLNVTFGVGGDSGNLLRVNDLVVTGGNTGNVLINGSDGPVFSELRMSCDRHGVTKVGIFARAVDPEDEVTQSNCTITATPQSIN